MVSKDSPAASGTGEVVAQVRCGEESRSQLYVQRGVPGDAGLITDATLERWQGANCPCSNPEPVTRQLCNLGQVPRTSVLFLRVLSEDHLCTYCGEDLRSQHAWYAAPCYARHR